MAHSNAMPSARGSSGRFQNHRRRFRQGRSRQNHRRRQPRHRALQARPARRPHRCRHLRAQRSAHDGLVAAASRRCRQPDPAQRHPRHQDHLHRLHLARRQAPGDARTHAPPDHPPVPAAGGVGRARLPHRRSALPAPATWSSPWCRPCRSPAPSSSPRPATSACRTPARPSRCSPRSTSKSSASSKT